MNVQALPSVAVKPVLTTRTCHVFLVSEVKEFELVEGVKLKTAPLIPGTIINLLGITSSAKALEVGFIDQSDMLSTVGIGLERLYYRVGTEQFSVDFMWDRYLLGHQPQDNFRYITMKQVVEFQHQGEKVSVLILASAQVEKGEFVYFFQDLEGLGADCSINGADFHIERINLNRRSVQSAVSQLASLNQGKPTRPYNKKE